MHVALFALLAIPALAAPQEQATPQTPTNIEQFPTFTEVPPVDTPQPRESFTDEFPNLETFPTFTDANPTTETGVVPPPGTETETGPGTDTATFSVEPTMGTITQTESVPGETSTVDVPPPSETTAGADGSPTPAPPENAASGFTPSVPTVALGLMVWYAVFAIVHA